MAHWHPGPVFREKWFARQSRGARRIEFYAFSASISPPRTRQTMLVAVERGVKQALEAWDNLRLAAWEQCRPRLHLHHCHDLHAVRSVSALTLTLAASFRAQLPKQMTGKMVCNVCVFFLAVLKCGQGWPFEKWNDFHKSIQIRHLMGSSNIIR